MTIVRKFDTTEAIKDDSFSSKFSKKFIVLTMLVLLILTVIEVWASNTVVMYGEKFEKMSALQQALKMENQILENEIARHSTLSNIASQSAMLGFSPVQSVEYIK